MTKEEATIQVLRNHIEALEETIKALEQEPKTGHWIEVHPLQEDDGGAYMCSKCRCGHPYIAPHWKYCPNCGCRMVEPQESEEKK